MNWFKFKHFYKNKYFLSKVCPNKYFLCYNYKYKVLWFRVAKVGSRTIDSHFRENTPPNQYIYSSPTAYNPNDFQDFFKFAFVRNPEERFVSAWKNKVLDSNYFNFSDHEHHKMKELDNFLNWVSKLDLRDCDEHLRLQSCLIDVSNLDYLGRMENFEDDFKFISKEVGLEISKLEFKNRSSSEKIAVTAQQIEKIKNLYKLDYQVFYPFYL